MTPHISGDPHDLVRHSLIAWAMNGLRALDRYREKYPGSFKINERDPD